MGPVVPAAAKAEDVSRRRRMNRATLWMHVRIIWRVILLPTASAVASAQNSADSVKLRSAHGVPVPSVTASVRSGPIRIGGHIDEDAWNKATPVIDFLQTDPSEGKPATQRTEVRSLVRRKCAIRCRPHVRHSRSGRHCHPACAPRRQHGVRLVPDRDRRLPRSSRVRGIPGESLGGEVMQGTSRRDNALKQS